MVRGESRDGSVVGINYEGGRVLCFSSNKEAETLAEALAAGAGFDMDSHASAVRTLERMGHTCEGASYGSRRLARSRTGIWSTSLKRSSR